MMRVHGRPVAHQTLNALGLVLVALTGLPALGAAAQSGVTATVLNKGTPSETVRIENACVRLDIVPGRGGVCTTLAGKGTLGDLRLGPNPVLLAPVFSESAMEKGPPPLPMRYRIDGPRAGRVSLVMEATLDAKHADPAVEGLVLRRTVTLRAGRRDIRIDDELVNKTADPSGARIGMRQRVSLNPVVGQDTYYLPTQRNVLRIVRGGIDNFYAKASDWEYKPVDGWAAVLGKRAGSGLVFVMDAKHIDSFYTHNRTCVLGWFVDGGFLDPGASFKTTCTMLPVHGFAGFVHASPRLIADVQVSHTGGAVTVTHTLAACAEPLGDVRLTGTIEGAHTHRKMTLPVVTLRAVGDRPVQATLRTPGAQTEPWIIRVRAAGRGWTESYEAYHEGKFRTSIYPGYPWDPEHKRTRPRDN